MKTTVELSKSLLFAENIKYVAGLVNTPASKDDIIRHLEVAMLQRDIYSTVKKKMTKTIFQGLGLMFFGASPFFAMFTDVFNIKNWFSVQGFSILVFISFCVLCFVGGAHVFIKSLKMIHGFENTSESIYDLLLELGQIYFGICVDVVPNDEYWTIAYTVNRKISGSQWTLRYDLKYFLHASQSIGKNDEIVCLFADEDLNCIL